MYPVIRLLAALRSAGQQPPIAIGDTHVSHHICMPWDIDIWQELNNGRTLTLYDLGRFAMFRRLGILPVMREKSWIGTVAGASIRYRRRVRMFDRIEMRSRMTGWDHRFMYAEHSMWRKGECTSHTLIRLGVTDAKGLVPTAVLVDALGIDPQSPPLPDWITAWAEAEAQRPWPPMSEDQA